MVDSSLVPIVWRGLARQNGLAAKHLCETRPKLACPIVSRLYYSLHQAAVAKLLEGGDRRARWEHQDVWDEAGQKIGLAVGDQLSSLYGWRVKADYAKGRITEQNAAQLAAKVLPMLTSLGIDLETTA